MIYGIGHDIVENERIKRLLMLYGERFITKILTTQEISIYNHKTASISYLAKRFAAKEAFAKACGTGLRYPVTLSNISILNDTQGKPIITFAPELADWLKQKNIHTAHLSISDEKHYSSAFVVLEGT